MITFAVVLVVLIFINIVLIVLSTYKVDGSSKVDGSVKQTPPDALHKGLSEIYSEHFGSVRKSIPEPKVTSSPASNPTKGKEAKSVPTKQKESKSVQR